MSIDYKQPPRNYWQEKNGKNGKNWQKWKQIPHLQLLSHVCITKLSANIRENCK